MQCYFVPRQGCFAGALASAWVYLYHAAFRGNESIENEESEIRMSLIHQDLSTCASRLATREAELSGRIRTLTAEAAHRKSIMDINGAKKRLVERKRAQLQLEKITSSMSVIDMHMSTIEGTELNRSILETLRASGDALRRLGAKGGVEEVERVVNEVENQVESAAEISRIIAAANVTGSIGGMGHDVFSEEELEAELNELLDLDPPAATHTMAEPQNQQHAAPRGEFANRFPPVPVPVGPSSASRAPPSSSSSLHRRMPSMSSQELSSHAQSVQHQQDIASASSGELGAQTSNSSAASASGSGGGGGGVAAWYSRMHQQQQQQQAEPAGAM